MFIDVHCHLDLLKDIPDSINKAKEKGVGAIVTAGIDYATNRKVLELSERYNIVKAALGVYPIDALKMSEKGIDEEIKFIRNNKEKIIAIGEVGMDFKESNEVKRQEETFLKFIKLAKELGKPLIVHSRKSEERCIEILEAAMAKKIVMHCFCGSLKLVRRIVENGWYLSIPTNVVSSEQFQKNVIEVNIRSLLCETDSPFLHPLRQEENTPENVIYSYEKIAELKSLQLRDVERKIEENYKGLFNI